MSTLTGSGQTLNPESRTLHPKPQTLNPEPNYFFQGFIIKVSGVRVLAPRRLKTSRSISPSRVLISPRPFLQPPEVYRIRAIGLFFHPTVGT